MTEDRESTTSIGSRIKQMFRDTPAAMGWLTLLVLAFGLLFTWGSYITNQRIESLKDKLLDCEKARDSLRIELDALKEVAATSDTSFLCPYDTKTFFGGDVTVTLQEAVKQRKGLPRVSFIIEDLLASRVDTFVTVGDVRNYQFSCGEEQCFLHLLSYDPKTKPGEICVTIRVRKKEE
jgi:hypothetical protein